MNILFVDDDEKVLAMLRRNQSHRFQLDTCAAPLVALGMIRSSLFTVREEDPSEQRSA